MADVLAKIIDATSTIDGASKRVDPRTSCKKEGILEWYQYSFNRNDEVHYMSLEMTFHSEKAPSSFKTLDNVYSEWIGPFMHEIYTIENLGQNSLQRFGMDTLNSCSKFWMKFCSCCPCMTRADSHYTELGEEMNELGSSQNQGHRINQNNEWARVGKDYKEEQILRDLFLWALFTTEIDLAKVFLLHLKPRICAALIATRVYKHFSKEATNAFSKQKLMEQAMEFEKYATDCVETCYAYNEKLTCELLIREVPLFGYVTCMQHVDMSSRNQKNDTPNYDKQNYMMLYKFDAPGTTDGHLHWTEIYVIITVSALLLEELRELTYYYRNRMQERWYQSTSWLLATFSKVFYVSLYVLFYLGLIFRYGYGDAPNLLTTARILMAFDLELWYLQSLKFIIVLEYLGPKLFMIKNMLRDLSAFVYIIFIFIAAYGVVSRAMISYQSVTFDGDGIFSNIFYPPYWFIYGNTQNELDRLDEMIAKDEQKSNKYWDNFENAATYSYARSAIEKQKKTEDDAFRKKDDAADRSETGSATKEELVNINLELQKLNTVRIG
ncbi:unnamed protein product [Didymodactylos carnosus]|uniref:TRPM-like domain-containing protein n=1 Tax=Didymodactylos carnosus TaxID=1234261 RepID=A0A8S2PRX9_9BILA|nr:unnamed protein product [Didymodactylos carnosus]CAF4065062.1 unnamed protein product [Didymodactylos carnosus]